MSASHPSDAVGGTPRGEYAWPSTNELFDWMLKQGAWVERESDSFGNFASPERWHVMSRYLPAGFGGDCPTNALVAAWRARLRSPLAARSPDPTLEEALDRVDVSGLFDDPPAAPILEAREAAPTPDSARAVADIESFRLLPLNQRLGNIAFILAREGRWAYRDAIGEAQSMLRSAPPDQHQDAEIARLTAEVIALKKGVNSLMESRNKWKRRYQTILARFRPLEAPTDTQETKPFGFTQDDVQQLRVLAEIANGVWDEGPEHEGWKSDELIEAIASARLLADKIAALLAPPTT